MESARRATPHPLLAEMEVTDAELERRKAWLKFDDEDIERLRGLKTVAGAYSDEIVEQLYEHFLSFNETRAFFRDPAVLNAVKQRQKQYFLRLLEGDYDRDYFEERLTIGAVHARIGLDVKWYLGAYNFYLRLVEQRILADWSSDAEQAQAYFQSLMKLVFLDIGLAIDTYIYQRERTIREQQATLLELSTPVLQLRDRLLILPIIGSLDSNRAYQLTEHLLHSIRANRAKVVVMDITGVPAVDSRVANHLVQTVEASRLMGATVIVTGLSAEIAQTLVTIGVDLSKMNTVGDLQGGIEEAERLLGYELVRRGEAAAQIQQA
jgi:rsbT co-antagonist protein RsbR